MEILKTLLIMKQTYKTIIRTGWLAALMACMVGHSAFSQISSDYFFQRGRQAYVPIAVADSNLGTASDDDERYAGIRLKMRFPFNGRIYSTISVSSNGYVVMGSTIAFNIRQALNNTNDDNVIAVLNSDLVFRNRIKLDWAGTAPNRSLTLEWKDARRYLTFGDTINAQLKLYENGRIEMNYGRFASGSPLNLAAQIGIRGIGTADAYALQGTFTRFTAIASATATIEYSDSSKPANGTLFSFVPVPPSAINLQLAGIALPGTLRGCPLSSTQTVVLRIRNRGTQPVSTATIGYRVDSGAYVNQVVRFTPPLTSGQTQTVSLNQTANLSNTREYVLNGYVTAIGDSSRQNDSATVFAYSSAPRPAPPISNGFRSIFNNGWHSATGADPRLSDTSYSFNNGGSSFGELGFNSRSAEPGSKHWLYFANIAAQPNPTALRFSIWGYDDSTRNNAITSMQDDTLSIAVSTDCGANWRIIRDYTQADVAAGLISTTLNTDTVSAVDSGAGASVAFIYKRGTEPSNGHEVTISSLELFSTKDIGIANISFPNINRFYGCTPFSQQETVSVTVQNYGSGTIYSARVAYYAGRTRRQQVVTFGQGLAPGERYAVNFTGTQGLDVRAGGQIALSASVFCAQ